jgi:hypothetical protein
VRCHTPQEALYHGDGHGKAIFDCDLEFTVKHDGLSYGSHGYHPFVESIKEIKSTGCGYPGSLLEQFYAIHQPANAAEAFVGFDRAPKSYRSFASYAYRLSPLTPGTPEAVIRVVQRFTERHGKRHAKQNLTLERDGYQYHGPVSDAKGWMEHQRLSSIYRSIHARGYDSRCGYAHFVILKRGREYRYLLDGSGNHRTACMAALGYQHIPAVLQRAYVVDVDMAAFWPQVVSGLWTMNEAVAYLDYLFDFDSRGWARSQGLLFNEPREITLDPKQVGMAGRQ